VVTVPLILSVSLSVLPEPLGGLTFGIGVFTDMFGKLRPEFGVITRPVISD